jgi:GntR family transcriptional regulator/MocR family aminotransferase
VARSQYSAFAFSDIRIDGSVPVPKHRQIYDALREAILGGKLLAGEALPSTRALSRSTGVSRNTVLAAYDLLIGEGFAETRGGAGTFVATHVARPSTAAAEPVLEPRQLSTAADALRVWWPPPDFSAARPFGPSSPALDAFPVEAWARLISRNVREDPQQLMSYGSPQGSLRLRKQIAHHLRAFRSSRCEAEQIIVTNGAQSGFYLCSMVLMDPDDPVWFEEPGYPNARLAFRARSSRIIPVPVDDSGLDIDAGRALSPKPRVIYVTPTHQWPLGGTMPVQRRLALLEYAASHGAWVVEDDYDGDLRYDGKSYASLQGLDESHRVIHIGTFSKTIYPALRLGYAVVPPDLIDSFVAVYRAIDRFPNTLAQAVMATFMEQGMYAKHVHKMRMIYAERHELLRARIKSKLAGALVAHPSQAGLFTVTEIVNGLDDVGVVTALAAVGIDSVPLSIAYTGRARKHGLILGHATAQLDQIRRGVDEMERVFSGLTAR